MWKNVERFFQAAFFQAATAGLRKCSTGSYSGIGVYRVNGVSSYPGKGKNAFFSITFCLS